MNHLLLVAGKKKNWKEAVFVDDFRFFDPAGYTIPDTDVDVIVTDTEGKFSSGISGLSCSGGRASPAYGDPGIWWRDNGGTFNISPGELFVQEFQPDGLVGVTNIGLSSLTSGFGQYPLWQILNASVTIKRSPISPTVQAMSNGETYRLATLRLSHLPIYGMLVGSNFYPLWIELKDSLTDSVFPAIANYSGVFNSPQVKMFRIPALSSYDFRRLLANDSAPTNNEEFFIGSGGRVVRGTVNSDATLSRFDFHFAYKDSNNYARIWSNNGSASFALAVVDDGAYSGVASMGTRLFSTSQELTIYLSEDNVVTVWLDGVLLYGGPQQLSIDATSFEKVKPGWSASGSTTITDMSATPSSLGIATDRVLLPNTNSVFTTTKDCWIVLKGITLPPSTYNLVCVGGNQTSGNAHVLFVYSTGEIRLYNYENGAFSQNMISAAEGSVVDGDDLMIKREGGDIQIWNNGTLLGSASGRPECDPGSEKLQWTSNNLTSLQEIYSIPIPVDLSKVAS